MLFAPSKSRKRTTICYMAVSKTSDHIIIKIKIQNPIQELSVSSKAPSWDLEDIKIESKNLEQWCIKDQCPYPNVCHHAKPQSKPQAPSKAPNQNLKDMDDLCTFKIILDSQNFRTLVYQRPMAMILEHWRILSFSTKNKYESNSNLTAEHLWANHSWTELGETILIWDSLSFDCA